MHVFDHEPNRGLLVALCTFASRAFAKQFPRHDVQAGEAVLAQQHQLEILILSAEVQQRRWAAPVGLALLEGDKWD